MGGGESVFTRKWTGKWREKIQKERRGRERESRLSYHYWGEDLRPEFPEKMRLLLSPSTEILPAEDWLPQQHYLEIPTPDTTIVEIYYVQFDRCQGVSAESHAILKVLSHEKWQGSKVLPINRSSYKKFTTFYYMTLSSFMSITRWRLNKNL